MSSIGAFDTPIVDSPHLPLSCVYCNITSATHYSQVVVSFCSSMISYDLYMFLLQGSREHFRLGLTEEVGSFVWFAIRISQ